MTSFDNNPGLRLAPPSVDLAGHFRNLGRVALPALFVGILVGVGVFALRSTMVPKSYSASVITQINPAGDIIPGDAFVEQLRAPITALATDQTVLNKVLAQVNTGWTPTELSEHVKLVPGTSPSLLAVTATASSPEQAEQVAKAMVTALAEAAKDSHTRDVGDQITSLQKQISDERARNATLPAGSAARSDSDTTLSDLRSQLSKLQESSGDTVDILATPTLSSAAVAPNPTQEGLVAGVVGAIVAAELIVFFRGRTGRHPNVIWARRMSNKYGLRRIEITGSAPATRRVVPLVRNDSHDEDTSSGRHHRIARVSTGLLLVGDRVSADDEARVADAPQAATIDRAPQRLPLRPLWWHDTDLGTVSTATLLVSTTGSDRALAESALAQLADVGASTSLVLLRRKRFGSSSTSPQVDATSRDRRAR